MIFGKQNSTEALEKLNSLTARSIAATAMDRRNDETSSSQDNVSVSNSKLSPLQPENSSVNLVARYETPTANQLLALNRIQTIVRDIFLSNLFLFYYIVLFIENKSSKKNIEMNEEILFVCL